MGSEARTRARVKAKAKAKAAMAAQARRQLLLGIVAAALAAAIATILGFAISDGRYVLHAVNRLMPVGPLVVNGHVSWRRRCRAAAPALLREVMAWEASGNSFPEFTSLTPKHYFPEAAVDSYGRAQKRPWGFLWLRLYGKDSKLATAFPELVGLYDGLPVEVYSLGISLLEPGRGDVTHFGRVRPLVLPRLPQSPTPLP